MAYASNLGDTSNNVVEAMVLLCELKLLVSLGWKHVSIEGDSMLVVKVVKGNYDPR